VKPPVTGGGVDGALLLLPHPAAKNSRDRGQNHG